MSQHILRIRTFDKSQSIKVIINTGERFQNDIFHDAHFVYPDKMYSSISPNTTMLPNYFRISVFSTECLSTKPAHCLHSQRSHCMVGGRGKVDWRKASWSRTLMSSFLAAFDSLLGDFGKVSSLLCVSVSPSLT